jgi:Tfp pilus assembly protein PilX
MIYRCKHLVVPLAGVLVLGLAGTALAQSATAHTRAAANSAVAQGTSNGSAAILKGENRSPNAVDTGKTARHRGDQAIASGPSATVATTAAAAESAPVALALDSGPPPASNPEPLTILTIGGAIAGLYRLRRHLA